MENKPRQQNDCLSKEQNFLKESDKCSPMKHLCEMWLKSSERLFKESILCHRK